MTDKQYEWLLKRLSKNKEDLDYFNRALEQYEVYLENVNNEVYLLERQMLSYIRLVLTMLENPDYRRFLTDRVNSLIMSVESIYQCFREEALEKKKKMKKNEER